MPEVWNFNMFRTEHIWRLVILSCGSRCPGRHFHAATAVKSFSGSGVRGQLRKSGGYACLQHDKFMES